MYLKITYNHVQEILIQAVSETMLPKLVADDIPLLHSLLSDVFPNIPYTRAAMLQLKEKIQLVCKNNHYVYGEVDTEEPGSAWVDKVLQLCQIQTINHGLMMVGPSGSGKSAAWQTLLTALELLDGTEGVAYVIDPKAISKGGITFSSIILKLYYIALLPSRDYQIFFLQ